MLVYLSGLFWDRLQIFLITMVIDDPYNLVHNYIHLALDSKSGGIVLFYPYGDVVGNYLVGWSC